MGGIVQIYVSDRFIEGCLPKEIFCFLFFFLLKQRSEFHGNS